MRYSSVGPKKLSEMTDLLAANLSSSLAASFKIEAMSIDEEVRMGKVPFTDFAKLAKLQRNIEGEIGHAVANFRKLISSDFSDQTDLELDSYSVSAICLAVMGLAIGNCTEDKSLLDFAGVGPKKGDLAAHLREIISNQINPPAGKVIPFRGRK